MLFKYCGDLCRVESISSEVNNEKLLIRQKFENATSYILPSETMSISRIKGKTKKMGTLYLLTFLKLRKVLVEFPYCPQTELVAKRFLSKFHQFTNQKFQVTVKWITKKVKNLLSLKDKKFQIYKWTCICEEAYIGERIWNIDIRWNEHEDIHKKSKPAKH